MTVELLDDDNLGALIRLLQEERRFTLVYADPPFFTQADWTTDKGELAYSDRWKSLEHYIAAVSLTASMAFNMLEPHGSIVIHIDPRVSHYVKVALDNCISRKHFASEIIWRYRRWPTKTTNFQRVHDVLLRYVKDPDVTPRWNQLYEPLSESTLELTGGLRQKGDVGADGRRRQWSTSEESPGCPLGDVWDIPIVAPSGNERTGYPTQKPEALLARLLESLTNPGDWVLDPYCGSGTTLAVAHRLGRHAVGIDASDVAIRYARERLAPLLAQGQLFDAPAAQ